MTRRQALWIGAGLVALLLLWWLRSGGFDPGAAETRIRALQAERDVLRARMEALAAKDARAAGIPAGDVVVGVPPVFIRSVAERVLAGAVDRVTLTLRGLSVHKSDVVKKLVTLGTFEVDVAIDEVRGTLEPGVPKLSFGGDRITAVVPVRIASGTGEARVHLKWDGRNLAGVVCGDLDVTLPVTGTVVPETYTVSGSVVLSVEGKELVATPRFPPLSVKLRVKPSAASWAAVQSILDAKRGVCGFVLDRVNVKGRIEELVGHGFDVTLPTERLKPMRLPAGIEESVTLGGRRVSLQVRPGGLTLRPEMLWFGAGIQVTGPRPSPAPR